MQSCHIDLASVHFHNVSVFSKNERYLCSIHMMWLVLLQWTVLNILCNDCMHRILHLYYCKFPYKVWEEVLLESKRQTIHWHNARGHCLPEWLLLETNPVLCPSRKMDFDVSIMGYLPIGPATGLPAWTCPVKIPLTSQPLSYCIDLSMKMEPIEGSETSAISTQTPGKHPKGNIKHGVSLKSRIMGLNSMHTLLWIGPLLTGKSYLKGR
jgi:hypothetical protein